MRLFHILLLATAVGAAGCGREPAATADSARPAAVDDAGSPAVPGQLGLCASCHGRNGIAVIANTPNLAGRPREELLAAMQAYLDGTRDYAPMRAMLGPIRPEQRENLAAWFAAQPAAPAGDAPP